MYKKVIRIVKTELKLFRIGVVMPVLLRSYSRSLRMYAARRFLKAVGKNTAIMQNVFFMEPKNITIGSHCVLNANVVVDGRCGVKIGNNVDIARDTHIWSLEHNPHSDTHETRGACTVIEDYAWISSRVSIMPGVHIGRGAVVACGAVVTRDVPEKCIVAGVPARVIGKRESLLEYEINWFPKYLQY